MTAEQYTVVCALMFREQAVRIALLNFTYMFEIY